jgi:hypothetical protein
LTFGRSQNLRWGGKGDTTPTLTNKIVYIVYMCDPLTAGGSGGKRGKEKEGNKKKI